jgi:hypothetical protein
LRNADVNSSKGERLLEQNLVKALSNVENLLRNVDQSDSMDMFDCLIEIEISSRKSVADHSLSVLSKTLVKAEHSGTPNGLAAQMYLQK